MNIRQFSTLHLDTNKNNEATLSLLFYISLTTVFSRMRITHSKNERERFLPCR